MKCNNVKCGKTFEKPLELFNGATTCPYCKKEQTIIGDFKVTSYNEELYVTSELYYFRYLGFLSKDSLKSTFPTLMQDELLEMAIETCLKSANLGNPKAIYKMGFYNEHYLESIRSETDRLKMAFDYYSALCYSDKSKIPVEDGIKGYSEEEFKDLKKQSAYRILDLFMIHEKKLKGAEKYDKEKNIARIKELYGNLAGVENGSNSKKSKVESVKTILATCFSKKRAPLFGVFCLTGKEFKLLFSQENNIGNSKKSDLSKLVDKGFELWGWVIKSNINESHNYYRLSSKKRANDYCAKIDETDLVCLYFFNMAGKHEYLSRGVMRAVKKEISGNNNQFNLINILLENETKDYIFFDDDIVQYERKGFAKFKGAVTKMINDINKEN